jgi:hypothetical protein
MAVLKMNRFTNWSRHLQNWASHIHPDEHGAVIDVQKGTFFLRDIRRRVQTLEGGCAELRNAHEDLMRENQKIEERDKRLMDRVESLGQELKVLTKKFNEVMAVSKRTGLLLEEIRILLTAGDEGVENALTSSGMAVQKEDMVQVEVEMVMDRLKELADILHLEAWNSEIEGNVIDLIRGVFSPSSNNQGPTRWVTWLFSGFRSVAMGLAIGTVWML